MATSAVSATAEGKNYLTVNNKATTMYGVHIRPDLIIERYGLSSTEDYDRVLKPYFANAKEMGFNTVVCQMHWNKIETSLGIYNFTLWDSIYSYLNEYDLDVQLLWIGSNDCGYYTNCPSYILNDTDTYPRISFENPIAEAQFTDYMDYSNPALIEREKKAIKAVMNYLEKTDINRHTVMIQLENEANSIAAGSGRAISEATLEEAKAWTFVEGQEAAVINLVNELGLVVKAAKYPCVTRFNFVAYNCYNSYAELNSIKNVFDSDGIDIVGMDAFEPTTTMDNAFIDKLSYEGNIPHIAEAASGYSTMFHKILNAFKQGGGMMVYELKASGERAGVNQWVGSNSLSVYRPSENRYDTDFTERDGTQMIGGYYEASAADWKSFNKMVNAVNSQLATCEKTNFATFDSNAADGRYNLTVDGKEITVITSGKADNSYGTTGYVMKAQDGAYYLYSLKNTTTFSGLTGASSVEYFNGSEWVSADLTTTNSLTVTNGNVYRITF